MTGGDAGRPPLIAVLDYGIGNLGSAHKAMLRVGADARLTTDPAVVEAADGVVLPGVGAIGRCMDALTASGLRQPALDAIASGKPFLGICIGMQMLHRGSDEDGGVECLGHFDATVRLLEGDVKRPQMQWNLVRDVRPSRLLDSVPEPRWFYFVHSYAAELHADVVGVCDYPGAVTAVVERDNVSGTQFHPEKSGVTGLALLDRFARRCVAAVPTR